jgi:hypothetical protein
MAVVGDVGIKGFQESTEFSVKLTAPVHSVRTPGLLAWLAQAKKEGLECEIVMRIPRNAQMGLFEVSETRMAFDLESMAEHAEEGRIAREEPSDLPDGDGDEPEPENLIDKVLKGEHERKAASVGAS